MKSFNKHFQWNNEKNKTFAGRLPFFFARENWLKLLRKHCLHDPKGQLTSNQTKAFGLSWPLIQRDIFGFANQCNIQIMLKSAAAVQIQTNVQQQYQLIFIIVSDRKRLWHSLERESSSKDFCNKNESINSVLKLNLCEKQLV